MSSILLITQNCNGLRNKLKRQVCFRWFKKQNAEIVLIQETHWSKDIEHIIRNEWKGSAFFNHGNKNARGVAILIKKQSEIKLISEHKDQHGRFIIIQCQLHAQMYIIVNVYAPNIHVKREAFFKSLYNMLKQKLDMHDLQTHMIIGGDFNCVLNPKVDTFNVKSKYKTPNSLKQMMKNYKLIDIWRIVNFDKRQYTWRNKSVQVASRIDFVLTSKDLKNYVVKTDIRPVVSGDHNAVTIILKIESVKLGPGYWKFNSSLLTQNDYCEEIRQIIQDTILEKNNSCMSWRDTWELCKIRIKEYSIQFSKNKKNKEDNVTLLENRLQKLSEKMFDKDNEKIEGIIDEHEKITEQLEKIYKAKCQGSIIRSRVKWFEEGEKNSKYFMSLEKKNLDKSSILLLRDNKGKNIINQQQIRKSVHKFYSKLYDLKGNNHDLKKYFVDLRNRKLTEDLAESCEGRLTEKECQHASHF